MLRTKKDLRRAAAAKSRPRQVPKSKEPLPVHGGSPRKLIHRDGRAELPSFLHKFLYTASDLRVARERTADGRSGQRLLRGADSSIRYTAGFLPLTINASAGKLIVPLTKYF